MTRPVIGDRVVEILISTTFGIHHHISFFFDQKPEWNFFGKQCYCGCTSPVNKDREWINVPHYNRASHCAHKLMAIWVSYMGTCTILIGLVVQ